VNAWLQHLQDARCMLCVQVNIGHDTHSSLYRDDDHDWDMEPARQGMLAIEEESAANATKSGEPPFSAAPRGLVAKSFHHH
jgi:hypothetical protein